MQLSSRSGAGIVPVALLGLENDNLFVDSQGGWDAEHIPAFVRQYPFVYSQSKDGQRFTPCVDESWEGCNWEGRGERLFDEAGENTKFLTDRLGFLEEYRAHAQQTQSYCENLQRLQLPDETKVDVSLPNDQRKSLAGFWVVSRDKLQSLPPQALAELASTNELEVTYAHLLSLNNLSLLVRRATTRHGTVSAPQTGGSPGERRVATADTSPAGTPPGDAATQGPAARRVDESQAVVPVHQDFAARGATLLELVRRLGTRHLHERSVRIREKTLLTNRFLVTVNKHELSGDSHATILDMCRQLKMPQAFVTDASQNLSTAQFIHFGFEADDEFSLYKLYLEFTRQGERPAAVSQEDSQTKLLHRAYKWDPSRTQRQAVTDYHWHQSLTVDQIAQRLQSVYEESKSGEPIAIARGVLEAAAQKMPSQDIQYLEATEDDSCRRSFDLNVYDAELQIQDLRPLLYRMFRHYQIDLSLFNTFYQPLKTRIFGHLAGGTHRNGREFFNLYYGAEGVVPPARRPSAPS